MWTLRALLPPPCMCMLAAGATRKGLGDDDDDDIRSHRHADKAVNPNRILMESILVAGLCGSVAVLGAWLRACDGSAMMKGYSKDLGSRLLSA
jgi:hypothetical protein